MRGVQWTRSVWTFREDQRRRGMQRPLTHTSGPVWAAPCRRESYPEGGAGSTARWSATAVTSQKRLFSAKKPCCIAAKPKPAIVRQQHFRAGRSAHSHRRRARRTAPCHADDSPCGTALQAGVGIPVSRAAASCAFASCASVASAAARGACSAPAPHIARHASRCTAQAHVRDRRVVRERGAGTDARNGSGERDGGHKQGRARHAKAARVAAVLR